MSLTAGEVSLLLPVLLPERATVYGDDGSGAYATELIMGLRCRVLGVQGGQTQGQRAELATLREIVFDPSYLMPPDCQVQVGDTRYDPVEGTFRELAAGAGVVRTVDAVVVRTET